MANEFSGKGEKELKGILHEKQEKLRAFRFGMAGSKTKNVKEGKMFRKEIARILTELTAQKTK